MAVTAFVYGRLQQSLWEGRVNFASDTIKAMLLSSYTVGATQDTAQFLSDVVTAGVGVETSGSGYTAGGATLGTKSVTYTAANSWGTARANSTAYAVGDVYRPATGNGFVYRCVVAGTSAASPPTFTTVVGDDYADGTATFVCEGRGVLVVDAADPSWTTVNPGTLAGSHILFYKDTGTATTSPVIMFWDLGGTQTASNGGAFTAQLPSVGLLDLFTA